MADDLDTLSLAELERIDRRCLEFETAWQAGRAPRPEDFVAGCVGAEREQLLRELLLLDLDYRSRRPTKQEYETRFPDDARLVANVFGQFTREYQPADDDGRTAVASPDALHLRYQILHPHAQGGLGAVYVAQDQQLQRQVALKVMHPQYARLAGHRARFQREAEITGSLDHPGVAAVHGLGLDADGRPYYVMRLIHGQTLQEAVDRYHASPTAQRTYARSLEFRKLLGHFVDVCQTIEYAHEQRVLHRDIKPANIMLGTCGETMVVDWGLAKTLDEPDSPEVAEPADWPDPAADPDATTGRHLPPTAIGAAMGTPAFMSPEQAAGQLQRLGPRSDIYSLGATLYVLLTGRAPLAGTSTSTTRTEVQPGGFPRPRGVAPHVPPPLEAICLKAMASLPEARYASARELAEDIESWLADQPVTAYRDSPAARSGRWIRHHQIGVTGATAAGLVALLSLMVALALLAAKNRELLTANRAALAAQEQSRQHFELAMRAIEHYYQGVSQDVLLRTPQLGDLRTRLLAAPMAFYQQLGDELADDPSPASRRALAEAYYAIAAIALTIGSRAEAAQACQEAIEILQTLIAQDAEDLESRSLLSRCFNRLGVLHERDHRFTEAATAHRQAIELAQGLAVQQPADPRHQADLARCYNNLALLLSSEGKYTEALGQLEAAIRIHDALTEEYPDIVSYQSDLAKHEGNLGLVLEKLSRFPEALQHYERALQIDQRLLAKAPDSVELRENASAHHYNLGVLQWRRLGQLDTGYRSLQAAVQIDERLAATYPTVPDYQYALQVRYNILGTLARRRGERQTAVEFFDRAITVGQRLADQPQALTDWSVTLGGTLCNRGDLAADLVGAEDALPWYTRAITVLNTVHQDHQDHVTTRQFLLNTHWSRAVALDRLARYRESLADWEQTIQFDPDQRPQFPLQRARVLVLLGQSEEAIRAVTPLLTEQADPATRYLAARVFALASAADGDPSIPAGAVPEPEPDSARQPRAARYADRALQLLTQARHQGYFDSATRRRRLAAESDLASLHDREAFQRLLDTEGPDRSD